VTGSTRRITVPADPLNGTDAPDYADAFKVDVDPSDRRTAEELVRRGLEQAPWVVRSTIRIVHARVLLLDLAPMSAPGHILGWKIVTSEPDVVRLECVSPRLGRAVISARRPDPTQAQLATYLYFASPASRIVWTVVGPLHRLIAPRLLAYAAASDGAGRRSSPPRSTAA
jgi:hypothetical protein